MKKLFLLMGLLCLLTTGALAEKQAAPHQCKLVLQTTGRTVDRSIPGRPETVSAVEMITVCTQTGHTAGFSYAIVPEQTPQPTLPPEDPAFADSILLPSLEDAYVDRETQELHTQAGYLLIDGDTRHYLVAELVLSYDEATQSDVYQSTTGHCYAIGEDGSVTPCTGGCAEITSMAVPNPRMSNRFLDTAITPQNETYVLDYTGQLFQWKADSGWALRTCLDLKGIMPLLSYSAYEKIYFAVNGDELYAIYKNPGDGYTLYAFALADGSRRELMYLANVFSLNAGAPGHLLICGQERSGGYPTYFSLDTQTGETKEVVKGLREQEYGYGRYIYNRQNGWYYPTNSGKLQLLTETGEDQMVLSVPAVNTDFHHTPYATLSTDGSKLVLIMTDQAGRAYLHTLDLTQGMADALIFEGYTSMLHPNFRTTAAFAPFATANGQLLSIARENLTSAQDISQSMLTENDTWDILVTNANAIDLQNLYSKGYHVDLATEPAIAAYFDTLYPVWRDACMAGDAIIAFPLEAMDQQQFLYNMPLFDQLGLDVPSSYAELLLCIRQWHEEGLLEEYPLFEVNGIYHRSFDHLFSKLMGDYILQHPSLAFQDEELRSLLAQLETLRPILDTHDALNLSGPSLLINNGYVISPFEQLYEMDSPGVYQPLIIGYDSWAPVMQTSLYVMLVNPYSKHMDLAKDYLAYLAENPTDITRCVLMQGMPDGIETEKSKQNRTEWEEKNRPILDAYEEAKQSGDAEALETLRPLIMQVPREPEIEWSIRPEKARIFYQVLPYARVQEYGTYALVIDSSLRITESYLSGQSGADQLIQDLNALVMMIEVEVER